MISDSREEFIQALEQRQVTREVADWIHEQMLTRWRVHPSLNQSNIIDPDDCYEFIVEGTIELGYFRPSRLDIEKVSTGHDFSKFVEFAEVISALIRQDPEVGTEIIRVNENNCSAQTKEIWQSLDQLSRYQYNGQFFLKCYFDRRILSQVKTPSTLVEKVQNFAGKHFLWLNSMGFEKFIKQRGYLFEEAPNFEECKARVGSILKIKKKADENFDKFESWLLITEVKSEQIQFVEFKHSWNSPFRASLAGIEKFFFRDSNTKLEGIWNPPS
ncbi:MAG: hypothetical protein IT342_22270 [Candidatus Melainabacteria bacterium]|nr:hypothetical protein [Candidatus Melainabacteria bacterium]